MRTIKFRAWSPQESEYIEWFDVSVSHDDGTGPLYGWPTGMDIEAHDLLLEQFTGLHDKDGKEIFCNDVVQDSLTQQIYLVKFGYCLKLGFTGLYAESKDGYQCAINGDYGTDRNSCLVVLGSYNSNPELLK